jgi:hypothetical protein
MIDIVTIDYKGIECYAIVVCSRTISGEEQEESAKLHD